MKHLKPWMIMIILLGNLIAIATLIFSLYSFIAKPTLLAYVPNPDGAPLAFLIIGLTLLIASNRPWGRIIQQDTMPEEKRIEYHDERNVLLNEKSSHSAYIFLSIAILLSLCILDLLGFLSEVAFLMLYGLTTLSLLIKHIAKKYYANRI
ncbi:hypothetical protein [[Eubacterium] hominis]|uniref:hypothetical protein n=1 Tax=[Eubacterium] hominis TaxID=2764325 RepID=UPI003A4DA705